MLAEARSERPPERALPGGPAFEQKPDGNRTPLFTGSGRAHLPSRGGADHNGAFPEITAASRTMRQSLFLDGELTSPWRAAVSASARARRRDAGARQAARTVAAYLFMFDVLDTADGPLLDEPYRAGRALWELRFAEGVLAAPFVLCPAITDRGMAEDWIDPPWGAAGIEGDVTGLAQKCQSARGGRPRVRARAGAEARGIAVSTSLCAQLVHCGLALLVGGAVDHQQLVRIVKWRERFELHGDCADSGMPHRLASAAVDFDVPLGPPSREFLVLAEDRPRLPARPARQ
ncbi:ATP-dependent DNA ligase [Streptomyces flaveolus]|uniref:ATP-dependent DNA ligase n=1 Tax=Streptomyces flaveolus TaxID=67297 RepID=UPI003F4D04FB